MVKAKYERGEEKENLRVLQVEMSPEKLQTYMDQAFAKLRKDVTVPGFRKGKIPRPIFERHFGVEVLWQEALEKAVPDAYFEAIEELELEPIAPPEIDVDEDESGPEQGLYFSAQVEVVPEVKLGDYKDLGHELETSEVTDEDVEEALQNLREEMATAVAVEDADRELETGMMAVVNYQGFVDEAPHEDLQAEDETIEIGQGKYLPGFEEGLLGAKVGDTREVTVEFPPEAANPDLAGRDVVFEVEIKELKDKELPALDDAFAQEVSEGETVDDLRRKLDAHLRDFRDQNDLKRFEDQVVEEVVKNAEVDVPDVMVENLVERRLEEMKKEIESKDADWEEFLATRGANYESELRAQLAENGKRDLKETLVLEAVAEAEDIEVSEEEVDQEIEAQARSMGLDPGVLRQVTMTNTEYLNRLKADRRIKKTRECLAAWTDPKYDEVKEAMEARREEMIAEAQAQAEKAKAQAENGTTDESPSDEQDPPDVEPKA